MATRVFVIAYNII